MKLKLAVLTIAMLALTATAQTNIITDLGSVLGDVGISSNPTNYAASTFVGRSLKGNQTSVGEVIIENVNKNVGVAAGVDHLWGGGSIGSANIVAGGLTIKGSSHPLRFLGYTGFTSNLTATVYGIALVGTPINGTGSANGGLSAVNRAGAVIDFYNYKGWQFSIGADYGNRTGAGNYSGNWIDGVFTIRKGF